MDKKSDHAAKSEPPRKESIQLVGPYARIRIIAAIILASIALIVLIARALF